MYLTYVGITVESETELTPRTEFTYAPYTFAVNKANLADVATRALTADAVGGGVDLAINNSDANIRIIKNSTSPIDKNIYIGYDSGPVSKLYLYSNNEVTMSVENKNVGIGLSVAPTATLDVGRGAAGGDGTGTAIFRGTEHASHFNYGSAENTYIRAGKENAVVYINDTHYGNVSLAAGGGRVGIGIGSTVAPTATLDVARGTAGGDGTGTAIFRGTAHDSHFNSGSAENTHIRAGKTGAVVYINDSHNGNVSLAGGGGSVGIGSTAAANPQALLHIGGTGLVYGPAYYTNV
jgi:ribosomal protein S11